MHQKKEQKNFHEVISMEEYLAKRREIREKEQKKQNRKTAENSPVWLWAEVYV